MVGDTAKKRAYLEAVAEDSWTHDGSGKASQERHADGSPCRAKTRSSCPFIKEAEKADRETAECFGDSSFDSWKQRTRGLNLLPHKDYYKDAGCRAIAHGIKDGSEEACSMAANDMSKHVGPNDVLVPIPGRGGRARATRKLSEEIARLSGARVWDGLEGKERESVYEAKKEGRPIEGFDFGMTLRSSPPKGRLVLVDNVLATGSTARAAA